MKEILNKHKCLIVWRLNIKHGTQKSLNTHLTEFMKMGQGKIASLPFESFHIKIESISKALYFFRIKS